MMGGRAGNTHCGRWRAASYEKHDTGRLVCSLPAFHRGMHRNWAGWWWHKNEPPRLDWTCNGQDGTCGQVYQATEDEARVAGWKIGRRNGQRDPLCPTCAKPDRATAQLLKELAASVKP